MLDLSGTVEMNKSLIAATINVADGTKFVCQPGMVMHLEAKRTINWAGSAKFECLGKDAIAGANGKPHMTDGRDDTHWCLGSNHPNSGQEWKNYNPASGTNGGNATPAGDSESAEVMARTQNFASAAGKLTVELRGGKGAKGGDPGPPQWGEKKNSGADCDHGTGPVLAKKTGSNGSPGQSAPAGRDGTFAIRSSNSFPQTRVVVSAGTLNWGVP